MTETQKQIAAQVAETAAEKDTEKAAVETKAQAAEKATETVDANTDAKAGVKAGEKEPVSISGRELSELAALFPEASVSSIDARVMELRENGLPLSAAYAMREKERERSAARVVSKRSDADEINRENRLASAGPVGNKAEDEFYSPDEVRAMSPASVRDNYKRIISSMTRWK